MSALLFPETVTPVASRWVDPGDAPKASKYKRRQPNAAPREPRERKVNARPNPFRQPIADVDELDFRHMHWSRIRDLVLRTLVDTGTSPTAIARFQNCGAECVVEWSATAKRYRLRGSYCHSRHCQPCMKAKANLIAMNLKAKLDAGAAKVCDRFRFVTLTWKHEARPLASQIKDLRECFNQLRQTKLWKSSQVGGAAMFECHPNEKGEWHPHLHIMTEGDYISRARLSEEWARITGGSWRVDVQLIRTTKDVGFYVAKYVTKGTKDHVWDDPDLAREWVSATHGLRTCATFGTWRGFGLLKHDPATDVHDWKPIGLLSRIAEKARNGHEYELRLLLQLADALQYDPHKKRQKRDATADGT